MPFTETGTVSHGGVDRTHVPSYVEGVMYANAPQASAATHPMSPLTTQHQAAPQGQVHTHGHAPHGMPPAAPGGPHGTQHGAAQAAAPAYHAPVTPRPSVGAAFVTGQYQASGDPMIDRMIRLEAACKRFGSPI